MGNAGKYLIGATIAIVAILFIGLLGYAIPQRNAQKQVAPQAIAPSLEIPPRPQSGTELKKIAPAESANQTELISVAETIPPLPPNATAVPDRDLLALAQAVDLPNATSHRPDKERWKQALLVAERLEQGPCDCEQRNWLTHFIEMGHFALVGPEADYREAARLLSTLGRNDAQAMALSQRSR